MAINKIVDPNLAAKAYSNSSNVGNQKGVSGDDGVSFSEFLKEKARESVDTLRQSEQMSARAVTGDADIADVVQAITAAETTLQTVVSVRDRLVTAYQDIMRMPI